MADSTRTTGKEDKESGSQIIFAFLTSTDEEEAKEFMVSSTYLHLFPYRSNKTGMVERLFKEPGRCCYLPR